MWLLEIPGTGLRVRTKCVMELYFLSTCFSRLLFLLTPDTHTSLLPSSSDSNNTDLSKGKLRAFRPIL